MCPVEFPELDSGDITDKAGILTALQDEIDIIEKDFLKYWGAKMANGHITRGQFDEITHPFIHDLVTNLTKIHTSINDNLT